MPANLIPGIVAEFAYRNEAFRFFVLNLVDVIQNYHANGTFYEEEELTIIERHLEPGSVYLDIGSNIGNHAIFVERFCKPKEVILVEPNPEALRMLHMNLLLNRSRASTAHLGVGLSDQAGSAEVAWIRNNLGTARMISKEDGKLRLVTGDSLFADRHIDFIKLDVEGLEISVLKGLARTIERSRPRIFIEVDNENLEAFEHWREANRYVSVQNFRRYRVNENFMLIAAEKMP